MSGALAPRTIPSGVPIRVVGDVHGDAAAFAFALATERFVVQLGDLADYGPRGAETLEMMFDRQDRGAGLFLLGNHDHKLARVLAGQSVRVDPELAATLDQLDDAARARALREIARAPTWIRRGAALFVHAGFHTDMLERSDGRPLGLEHARGAAARALFGEPTGRTQPDGYPERSLRWVDRIPAGLTVYCGHDRRSADGRPYVRRGARGGTAVFMDTGAGKGGHLSWIDLPGLMERD
ncbi:MAG TPA: metallophosphoesterase [Acetobacteraceae bacterium]|nr:metallophosphoesterase [Acetobacteraceae bacterium]